MTIPSAWAISSLAKSVAETEHENILKGSPDRQYTPWMPYQPADFIGILWECMPEIKIEEPGFFALRPSFLDVGCGPGTKMQIARDLFGFAAYGVEVDEVLANKAQVQFPLQVVKGDALEADVDYSAYDIIWLYRPFRDADKELALEQKITQAMKPGAILAGGSWALNIPGLGWDPVVDDTLQDPSGSGACIWRGAWQRPKTTTPTS